MSNWNLVLEENLPLFEPAKRHAVLVNGYDDAIRYGPGFYSRGNRRVYRMEMALRNGKLVGIEDVKPGCFLLPEDWELCQKNRQNLHYDSVSRVTFDPGEKCIMVNKRAKLHKTLAGIGETSSDDTLTFVYITSHGTLAPSGKPYGFRLPDGQIIPYKEMIGKLDEIRGKKTVVLFACYSGAVIDFLDSIGKIDDYIVMTSTQNREEGTNWGEDKLNRKLMKNIFKGGRMSNIVLPHFIEDDDRPGTGFQPQIIGSYDVVI